MFTRREFLKTGLAGSSLIALGSTVPGFLASTARAAKQGQDKVLVVVELTGGNDGLNTVIPYGDDRYHKVRPTLRVEKNEIIRIDDYVGLNPALRPLDSLLQDNQLAILQGIGYPNPNRSHFESMDVWQSADPSRRITNGWLGRSLSLLKTAEGRVPAFHVAKDQLPLALQGSASGIPTLHPDKPFGLQLSGPSGDSEGYGYVDSQSLLKTDRGGSGADRMQLVRQLTGAGADTSNSMLQFVQRMSLDTYTTIDRLQAIMSGDFEKPDGDYQYNFRTGRGRYTQEGLVYELSLVARMIQADFGARIYYVSLDGFDTHGDQRKAHDELLQQLATAISQFFDHLQATDNAERVLLVTFSEFGRRVQENGSQGTDHGAASCMFAAGPAVKGGLVGAHPSLEAGQLDSGDLKHHTDFRQVYATILDRWLDCDSRRVLGEDFKPVDFLNQT
jgi:uncharacterized protein (DUF1501 family)